MEKPTKYPNNSIRIYKNIEQTFLSIFVSKEDVLTEIKVLYVSKTIQESDIPVESIKENENFFAEATDFHFNKSLENSKFPNCQKLAKITPIFKKDSRRSKSNYRPVSILPFFSKIFERLLSKQLLEFYDKILYKLQCGFRKGY